VDPWKYFFLLTIPFFTSDNKTLCYLLGLLLFIHSIPLDESVFISLPPP
jgi:hypothetical protein